MPSRSAASAARSACTVGQIDVAIVFPLGRAPAARSETTHLQVPASGVVSDEVTDPPGVAVGGVQASRTGRQLAELSSHAFELGDALVDLGFATSDELEHVRARRLS